MSCIFQAEKQDEQNFFAPCTKLITETELKGNIDVKFWGPLVVVFSTTSGLPRSTLRFVKDNIMAFVYSSSAKTSENKVLAPYYFNIGA